MPLWSPGLNGSVFKSVDPYGHICTVTNATWGSQGMTFDGVNDSISCGTSSTFDFTTQNFTLTVWVYPVALEAVTRTLLCRSDVGSEGYLARLTNEGRIDFLTWAPAEGRSYTAISVVLINTWCQVTFVRNGTAALFYKNGAVVTNESSGTHNNLVTSAQPLLIGESSVQPSSGDYDGIIGEVSIHNRALSATEILYSYQLTKGRYL